MDMQQGSLVPPDAPRGRPGHSETQQSTRFLQHDLDSFSIAIHDSKERYYVQTSKGFTSNNERTLQDFIEKANAETSRINGASIGKLTKVFQLLQRLNSPNAYVESATLNCLFSVIQCTLAIGLSLGSTFKHIRYAIYPLEDLSLPMKIEELALDVVPGWKVWTILANSASHIVRFCTELIRCRTLENIAALQAPEGKLRELMQTLAGEVSAAQKEMADRVADAERRQKVEEEEEKQREEEQRRLTAWLQGLAGTTSTNSHQEIRRCRAENTCMSFLKRASNWLSEGECPVLWAEGPPGVGKSVLASAFIDAVSDDEVEGFQASALAYIYFAWDERQNQTPVQVYARLLLQLLPKLKKIEDSLKSLRKEDDQPECSSLRKILQDLPRGTVIVMDALDEAHRETSEDVSSLVEGIPDQGPRLLVFSRPCSDTPERTCVAIRILSEDDEMANYIMTSLRRHKKFMKIVKRRYANDPGQQDSFLTEMCDKILDRSKNMFLIAKFRVIDVCAQRSVKSMKDAASRDDSDPDAIYTRTWQRISETFNNEDVELAKKVIGWLTFAKRTLNVDELMEAISIQPGICQMDDDDKIFPESMAQVCEGLVVYDEQSEPRRLRLAHQTVQEHFARLPEFQDMKKEICRACFTYIIYMSATRDEWYREQEANSEDGEPNGSEDGESSGSEDGESNRAEDGGSSDSRDGQDSSIMSFDSDSYDANSPDKAWPANLSLWCSNGPMLSRYAGRYALKHLSDITIDGETQDLLVEFVLKMFSLRRRSTLTDAYQKAPWDMKILHLATYVGNRELVGYLLSRQRADVQAQDELGRTALMWALHLGKYSVAKLLLEKESEANKPDNNGNVAIHHAVSCCDEDLIHQLLGQTDSEHYKDSCFMTHAVEAENVVLVQALLDRNVDFSSVHTAENHYSLWGRCKYSRNVGRYDSVYKCNALHAAILEGKMEMFKILLNAGVDASVPDSDGNTPLLLSVLSELEEALHILLREQPQLCNTPNRGGMTPLHMVALINWRTSAIDDLLDAGANPFQQDNDGKIPLMLELRRNVSDLDDSGMLKRVQKLATSPDVVLLRGNDGRTSLHYAANRPTPSVISELLKLTVGKGLNDFDNWGMTPIALAAENGRSEVVEWLLGYPGISLTVSCEKTSTVLHPAFMYCTMDCVKAIIRKDNSMLNSTDAMGRTPLILAVRYRKLDVFTFLLSKSADPTIVDIDMENAFSYACRRRDVRYMNALLPSETWLDVNKPGWPPHRNRFGETVLHYAVLSTSFELVEKVVKLPGLSSHDRTLSGDTVLHVAIRDGDQNTTSRIAELLLKHSTGNLLSHLNSGGKSALDIALEQGNMDTIGLLVDAASEECCVGRRWDPDGDAIKRCDTEPWFPRLMDILQRGVVDQTDVVDSQWGVVKSRREELVIVSKWNEQVPYVSVQVPHGARSPVRRIVFMTLSAEISPPDDFVIDDRKSESYHYSETWFEASVLKRDSQDHAAGKRQAIQRNVYKKAEFSQHINTWDFRDTTLGLQEWLSSIQGGDEIQVIPRGNFLEINRVAEVEVTLYYDRGGSIGQDAAIESFNTLSSGDEKKTHSKPQ